MHIKIALVGTDNRLKGDIRFSSKHLSSFISKRLPWMDISDNYIEKIFYKNVKNPEIFVQKMKLKKLIVLSCRRRTCVFQPNSRDFTRPSASLRSELHVLFVTAKHFFFL